MDQSPPALRPELRAESPEFRRFLKLHSELANPKERFESFYNAVGLNAVQEYLDALDELYKTLAVEQSLFTRAWCGLIDRITFFESTVIYLSIESDEPLQREMSRLAFVLQHPAIYQNFVIAPEKRIEVINCKSSQEALKLIERLRSTQPATLSPENEAASAQLERFLGLHSSLPDPKNSFKSLYRTVGSEGVQEYLQLLDSLCNRLKENKSIFAKLWCSLLNRKMRFAEIVLFLGMRSDESLQADLSQVAFLHQHPEIDRDRKIPHEGRVQAIDAPSSEAAQKLLRISTKSESNVQTQIVARGYDHDYLNFGEIVDPTLATLESYASMWASSQYLAPFTSLIGPSMSGKTRLLKELSRRVCVVYICIRSPNSSGYPPRSDYAANKLLDLKCQDIETEYRRLLISILRAVSDFFLAEPDGTPTQRLHQWIAHSFPQQDVPDDPPFWREVQRHMDSISDPSNPNSGTESDFEEAISIVTQDLAFIQQTHLKIVLAIDEARELLDGTRSLDDDNDISFFRIFRRLLKKVPTASGFFSILADTTSRVSNFNPPVQHDPSARPGVKTRGKLYAPIYQIPTFDVNVSKPPENWQRLQSAIRLFGYGNPFWGVYADEAQNRSLPARSIVVELVQLALEKLLCTDSPSIPATSLTQSQAVALLGSTIQPQLYGAAQINAELVASHAAQCMYIDPSQELLISEYPSQFTFSSAANQYLASDDANLIQCIKLLAFTHRQGHVSSGDIGEIISRIILLRCMQETMKKTQPTPDANNTTMPFGHSVRLIDFLETLTGSGPTELELGGINPDNKDILLNDGRVFWNHFISVYYTPTSADLLDYLYRGAAVQCKPYQPGFDQIFPIYLLSKANAPLNENNVTVCATQVKNRKQPLNLHEASLDWTLDFAQIRLKKPNPYLVLYFGLRDSKTKPEPLPPETLPRKKHPRKASQLPALQPKIFALPDHKYLSTDDSQRRASLAFHSLNDFPFLTPGLITALEELLEARPNILSLHDKSPEQQKTYVKNVSPKVYPSNLSSSEGPSQSKRRQLSNVSPEPPSAEVDPPQSPSGHTMKGIGKNMGATLLCRR